MKKVTVSEPIARAVDEIFSALVKGDYDYFKQFYKSPICQNYTSVLPLVSLIEDLSAVGNVVLDHYEHSAPHNIMDIPTVSGACVQTLTATLYIIATVKGSSRSTDTVETSFDLLGVTVNDAQEWVLYNSHMSCRYRLVSTDTSVDSMHSDQQPRHEICVVHNPPK